MSIRALRQALAGVLFLVLGCAGARAQTEVIFSGIGMDTSFTFAHASLPGATGIDFRFAGGFAPMYPDSESHEVVVVFEWGPSASGPWAASPDNVKTVPGGKTAVFDTGVFHGPADAPWVRLHMYAGGLMTASGEFSHVSVIPEPDAAALMAAGLALLAAGAGRRRATPQRR